MTVFYTTKFMEQRTKKTMTDSDKLGLKIQIFFFAFLFEDLGQVLCQETLKPYLEKPTESNLSQNLTACNIRNNVFKVSKVHIL